MRRFVPVLVLVVLSVLGIYRLFYASLENIANLSPQGCGMSWMSPSYILQSEFDELWTPLSRRYTLWLYREVEWDTVSKHEGNPVVFIPGNAGSSHQVRSIASSAAHQYYSAPGTPDPTFAGLRPLDFFAVEFNEDLSALHGPTIDSQREYVSSSIAYILSTYPPPRRRVIIIGHSMGGIVARSLLTSPQKDGWNTTDIAAIITMSTPHSLAPARFDHAIDKIYTEISHWENSNNTNPVNVPTLAICGGSTDALIPSETCALPDLSPSAMKRYDASPWYRWTAHTTSLPGIWSGVGHREMVWCHQIRWRVARTALELGALSKVSNASDSLHAGRIISPWFPSPIDNQVEHESGDEESIPPLVLKNIPHTVITAATFRLPVPPGSSHAYLLPVGDLQPQNLTLLIAKGVLARGVLHPPKLPDHQSSFRLSLYLCSATGLGSHVLPESCISVDPGRGANSRLIPLPTPGRDFPDSDGVDESEGIVFWNGDVTGTQKGGWVAFMVEGGTDSRGTSWAIAGFDQERIQYVRTSTLGLLFSEQHIMVDQHGFVPFRISVVLPDLHSHALLVYRLRTTPSGNCADSLLPPLLHHTLPPRTGSSESHFYVETKTRPIFIASHSSGPFISSHGAVRGSILEIYTSGTCGVKEFKLGIDWRASLGRAASRYWSSLGVWAVGIVGLIMASSWTSWDLDQAEFLDPTEALLRFTTIGLPWLALLLMVLSVMPLPPYALLGNAGEVVFAPLAPLCLAMATALVWIIWGIALLLVRGIAEARRVMTSFLYGMGPPFLFANSGIPNPLSSSPNDSITQPYSTTQKIMVGSVICLSAAYLVPVQVIYVLLYVRHLWRCSVPQVPRHLKSRMSPPPNSFVPQQALEWKVTPLPGGRITSRLSTSVHRAQQMHVLLLLSSLLPFVASVLAVWARAVATAGLMAPFHGDHALHRIIFFVCAVESTNTTIIPGTRKRVIAFMISIPLSLLSAFAFVLGPRFSYGVYMMVNLAMALMWCRVMLQRRASG